MGDSRVAALSKDTAARFLNVQLKLSQPNELLDFANGQRFAMCVHHAFAIGAMPRNKVPGVSDHLTGAMSYLLQFRNLIGVFGGVGPLEQVGYTADSHFQVGYTGG